MNHDRNDIIKQFKKGLTINGLSKKFGYPYSTIRNMLERDGVLVVKKRDTKYYDDAATVNKVVKMYKDGYSTYGIAWNMGIPQHTIYSILRKNNVKMRKTINHKKYQHYY